MPIDLVFQCMTNTGDKLAASFWYFKRSEHRKCTGHVLKESITLNTHLRVTHVNCLCQTDHPHQLEAVESQPLC